MDDLIHKAQDAWVAELDNARKEAETQRKLAQASLEGVNKLLGNLYYGNKALGSNDFAREALLYGYLKNGLEKITDKSEALEWRQELAASLSRQRMYDSAMVVLNSILSEKT